MESEVAGASDQNVNVVQAVARADDYEGFPGLTQREAGRRQRERMYRWRLLCSGRDPHLVRDYCHGEGLSFVEAGRLADDLRIQSDVLSWKELEQKCAHSLGHFFSSGKDFRVPTVETLVDMAALGGESAVSELFAEHDLTKPELRRLSESATLRARVGQLAPSLIAELPPLEAITESVRPPDEPVSEPTPPVIEGERSSASTVQQNVEEDLHVGTVPAPASEPKRQPFDWEWFLDVGGPIATRVDTLSTECLDGRGRWRDDCAHPTPSLNYTAVHAFVHRADSGRNSS